MRISDWSSDGCSSDLPPRPPLPRVAAGGGGGGWREEGASVILGGPVILDGPIILLDRHPRPGPAIRTAPLDPAGQRMEYPLDVSATLNADPTAIRPATRGMIERLIAVEHTSTKSTIGISHHEMSATNRHIV